MKLEIGGGTRPVAGYINLDHVHGEGEFKRKLQDGIPLGDDSVEAAYASHVLEHIPTENRIYCMNEVWRVLKPGGLFDIQVPMFPTWESIADPTHVSYWVVQSFDYFTNPHQMDADYGIKYWLRHTVEVLEGWAIHAVLQKPLK